MMGAYAGFHQQYIVQCQKNLMMPTRDGVRLATDVYFPARDGGRVLGHYPVILERTLYDKASPRNTANAAYFARRGYICAIQDVRGRFASEGEWYPFALEAPDGYDTVEWLTRSLAPLLPPCVIHLAMPACQLPAGMAKPNESGVPHPAM
jgi:predicted acyl esterase